MPKKPYNRTLDEHLHVLVAQGNHEAYERLKKRYRFHSLALCRDILMQYSKTGISQQELMTVCNGYFLFIVKKYNPLCGASFFSFWKEITVQKIMEYLVNNSYTVSLDGIKRSLSIDQKFEDNHFVIDVIHEKDDHKVKQRKIFEIKNVIMRNEELFDPQEITLLNFILDGYTLAELEHSGMMSRSTLYHMFNTAVEKLQKLIKRIKGNKC